MLEALFFTDTIILFFALFRLLMICDYRENGCLDKIVLENYDNHVKACGYEMKTCRFIKCGQKILKMYIEQHEGVDCPHRESLCGGECGLMIALSDKPTHVCMDALKCHIDGRFAIYFFGLILKVTARLRLQLSNLCKLHYKNTPM